MIERQKLIARRRYLGIAMVAVLLPTLALALMRYFSARRTEAQTRAALEANLDLHLLGIVDEARRGMVDRANYITHRLGHTRLRARDANGLARSFARAKQRYPEIGEVYAVFFERGAETGEWRVLRYVAPAPGDAPATIYKGVPVGRLVEDPDTTEALRQAWLSIPERGWDATYTAFAPVSLGDSEPRQIFFHTVYEPNHVSAQDDAARVGLFAFSADAASYPSPNYLSNLVARFAERSVSGGDAPAAKRIEVAVRRDDGDTVIEVRDYGIGIAASDQRHIFNAFHRAAQTEVQTKRGTGLGLAIVREIALAHGGEVEVESKPGAGAAFRVRQPATVKFNMIF